MKALFERVNRTRQPPSPRFPPLSQPLSRFRGQFASALQDYERQTGINLVDHPLTKRLQGCRTVEDVMGILREQAQEIEHFHGNNHDDGDGRLMKSLRGAVYVLYELSISSILGDVIDLVRQRIQMGNSCL